MGGNDGPGEALELPQWTTPPSSRSRIPLAKRPVSEEQQAVHIGNLLLQARKRWLKAHEVMDLLQHYRKFDLKLSEEAPVRPPSGSLYLFDKKNVRYFRKDGYNWQKKKDGKTVRETHEKLKVDNEDALNCYYAHAEDEARFQRRCYWLLKGDDNTVLVHYLEVEGEISQRLKKAKAKKREDGSVGTDFDSPAGTITPSSAPGSGPNTIVRPSLEDMATPSRSASMQSSDSFPDLDLDIEKEIGALVGPLSEPSSPRSHATAAGLTNLHPQLSPATNAGPSHGVSNLTLMGTPHTTPTALVSNTSIAAVRMQAPAGERKMEPSRRPSISTTMVLPRPGAQVPADRGAQPQMPLGREGMPSRPSPRGKQPQLQHSPQGNLQPPQVQHQEAGKSGPPSAHRSPQMRSPHNLSARTVAVAAGAGIPGRRDSCGRQEDILSGQIPRSGGLPPPSPQSPGGVSSDGNRRAGAQLIDASERDWPAQPFTSLQASGVQAGAHQSSKSHHPSRIGYLPPQQLQQLSPPPTRSPHGAVVEHSEASLGRSGSWPSSGRGQSRLNPRVDGVSPTQSGSNDSTGKRGDPSRFASEVQSVGLANMPSSAQGTALPPVAASRPGSRHSMDSARLTLDDPASMFDDGEEWEDIQRAGSLEPWDPLKWRAGSGGMDESRNSAGDDFASFVRSAQEMPDMLIEDLTNSLPANWLTTPQPPPMSIQQFQQLTHEVFMGPQAQETAGTSGDSQQQQQAQSAGGSGVVQAVSADVNVAGLGASTSGGGVAGSNMQRQTGMSHVHDWSAANGLGVGRMSGEPSHLGKGRANGIKASSHIRSRSVGTPVELEKCFPGLSDPFSDTLDPQQAKSVAAMTELETRLMELQSEHQQILSDFDQLQSISLSKSETNFHEVISKAGARIQDFQARVEAIETDPTLIKVRKEVKDLSFGLPSRPPSRLGQGSEAAGNRSSSSPGLHENQDMDSAGAVALKHTLSDPTAGLLGAMGETLLESSSCLLATGEPTDPSGKELADGAFNLSVGRGAHPNDGEGYLNSIHTLVRSHQPTVYTTNSERHPRESKQVLDALQQMVDDALDLTRVLEDKYGPKTSAAPGEPEFGVMGGLVDEGGDRELLDPLSHGGGCSHLEEVLFREDDLGGIGPSPTAETHSQSSQRTPEFNVIDFAPRQDACTGGTTVIVAGRMHLSRGWGGREMASDATSSDTLSDGVSRVNSTGSVVMAREVEAALRGNSGGIGSGYWCIFGDTKVPAEVLLPGVLRCSVPPRAQAGKVRFAVCGTDEQPCSQTLAFEYLPAQRNQAGVGRNGGKEAGSRTCHECGSVSGMGRNSNQQAPSDGDGGSPPSFLVVSERETVLDRTFALFLACAMVDNGGANLVKLDARNGAEVELRRASSQEDGRESKTEAAKAKLVSMEAAELDLALPDLLQRWLKKRAPLPTTDLNAKVGTVGFTIVHAVAALGFDWAIGALAACGANINMRDSRGRTPLHWSASRGREKAVAALIAADADPGPRFNSGGRGCMPADLAVACGHGGIAAYLAEAALNSSLSCMSISDPPNSNHQRWGQPQGGGEDGGVQEDENVDLDGGDSEQDEAGDMLPPLLPSSSKPLSDNSTRRKRLRRHNSGGMSSEGEQDSEVEAATTVERAMEAAQKIQVVFREEKQRQDEREQAALRIQTAFRTWQERKAFLSLRDRIVQLQGSVRAYLQHQQYHRIRRSAVVAQGALRRRRIAEQRQLQRRRRRAGHAGSLDLDIDYGSVDWWERDESKRWDMVNKEREWEAEATGTAEKTTYRRLAPDGSGSAGLEDVYSGYDVMGVEGDIDDEWETERRREAPAGGRTPSGAWRRNGLAGYEMLEDAVTRIQAIVGCKETRAQYLRVRQVAQALQTEYRGNVTTKKQKGYTTDTDSERGESVDVAELAD